MRGDSFRSVDIPDSGDVSVLIVGGGINAAGLLRELALQGIDTLLVERSDFCSGTSAAGTRIIHGGLRYLENAEFRLVREALHERNLLLKNAPHYVWPLPTTIPIFDWWSGITTAARNFLGFPSEPGRRGALLVKAGLTVSDLLAGRRSPLPRHRFQSKREALSLRPELNPEVIAAATYYDAQIGFPERLCLELILDAEAISPQVKALNYVSVDGAAGDNVRLRDEISGETRFVRPRLVANAAGPWIDAVNRQLGRESRFIGGTRGSHLVLDHPQLAEATCGEMIYFANRDGRICLFYPIGGKVLVGSTDIPTEDPDALCSEEEVDYLLESLRQVFPALQVDRSDIVFRFSGVRPLPRTSELLPGMITRDHSHPLLQAGESSSFPIYSLVGGKWTTFRAFSEQVTDEILRTLGRKRVHGSANLAIGGGKGYPARGEERDSLVAQLAIRTGLLPERLSQLLDRYGTRAEEIAGYLAAGPDSPLKSHSGYSRREIAFLTLHEKVRRLEDLILRRTMIGLLGETTFGLLEEIASIAGEVMGATSTQVAAEIEETVRRLEHLHGVTPALLHRS